MNRGNLKIVIRMTGKASEVFALFGVLAKRHGAKTLGDLRAKNRLHLNLL
ncbi:unnamed protein product [marine sediment metagenome]|uniref:Uncharacterized protein n=1 Tax=marine sediment metagenome TaxID=412755 RepID=X1MD31_9ZZZZ